MNRIEKHVFLLLLACVFTSDEQSRSKQFSLPMQLCISPLNPCLQMHLNDPSVFKHMTFSLLHLWVFVSHSLMSKI